MKKMILSVIKIFTGEYKKKLVILLLCIIAITSIVLVLNNQPFCKEIKIWQGNDEYQYRIPGIVCTDNGTIIAYCEQRSEISDWASINIVEKISHDFGKTWSDTIVIVDGISSGHTINNPVMIVDGEEICLLYEVEYGLIEKQGGVYCCKSKDEGVTWSTPIQILTKDIDYNVIATGPGHGILTSDERLIVPVWMVKKDAGVEIESHHPGTVATIYSEDHGNSWKMGEIIPNGYVEDPNESTIVELSDGTFLMNIRNQKSNKKQEGIINYRAIARSKTGIDGWTEMTYAYNLPDPVCFGSIISYNKNTVIFTNCNSIKRREFLTVRVSTDNCVTWRSKLLSEKGGYADLAVDKDHNIYCLSEYTNVNDNHTYYNISLYVFNLPWIIQ